MEKSLCPRTDLLTNAPSLTIDVDKRIMEKMLRVAGLSVALAVVMAVPNRIQGQTTNNPPHTKKSEAAQETPAVAKKPGAGPFHGKLAAMDKVAKTITVGKRTFQITSETKIRNAGKPATFESGVIGEEVSGYVKPAEDGKWMATTVNFGPKAGTDSEKKKSGTAEK